ncbi:hypothetical protein BS78_10G188800 [Paspalum vaginatum]|nr:hypothetical protein BS78_10G188800 [Paspalum vaginatum]
MKLRTAPRLAAVVRTQKQNHGGGDAPQPSRNFIEEKRHIQSRVGEYAFIFDGLLYYESKENSELLCMLAGNAVTMASQIVDSAELCLAATPNDISTDTVRRTLQDHVETFVQTADATYNRTVREGTITSFLGALRGLASVSHILLEAALDALSRDHPRVSLSEYAFNHDVKIMYRQYNQQMTELEYGIKNARTTWHTCELVMPTVREGIKATESLVSLMIARRQRTLEKAQK